MFCKNCGAQIPDSATFCGKCGVRQREQVSADEGKDDKLIYGLIGFFIPIVGVILYLIYEKSRPVAARAAVKGAIISFIVSIGLSVLAIVGSGIVTMLSFMFLTV